MNNEKFKSLELKLMKKITKNMKRSERFIYEGIYHHKEERKAVVTDGRVLFATPDYYDERLNGLTIATDDFLPIDGIFPDYTRVVWNKENSVYKIENIEIPNIKSVCGELPVYLTMGGFSLEQKNGIIAALNLQYLEMLWDFSRFGMRFNLYVIGFDKGLIFEFVDKPDIVFLLMGMNLKNLKVKNDVWRKGKN